MNDMLPTVNVVVFFAIICLNSWGDVFVNASIEYDWIHLDFVKKNRLGLAGKQVPLRPCFEQFARGPNEDERLLHVAPGDSIGGVQEERLAIRQ